MSEQETAQTATDERSTGTKQHEGGRAGRSRHRHRSHTQPQPHRTERSLNMDELRELVQLFTENGLTEFELEREDLRIRLGRSTGPQSSTAPAASPAATAQATLPPATAHTQASPTSTGTQGASAAHPATNLGAGAEKAASEDEGLHIIASPILGTFYRSPSPTSEPFVRIGSHVEPDTVVCIIEAMKLMNEIQAEVRGEVAKIYVENGQPVEYGQPLFGIKAT